MYTYGCLNTRREPFTTNGRPPPQGGYIQSSSLLSFLSLFLFSKLLSLKRKIKLLSPKSNGNTCTETRQLSHWTTDAASAILFSASTGGILQSLLPSSHGRVRLHEVGAAAPVHPCGGNIRKVVRTPFHIFVPRGPVDGRKCGLVRSRQKYKNSDFHPVVPMYHISHYQ